jgi:hypothetical protein
MQHKSENREEENSEDEIVYNADSIIRTAYYTVGRPAMYCTCRPCSTSRCSVAFEV